jgi:hypothetical protein
MSDESSASGDGSVLGSAVRNKTGPNADDTEARSAASQSGASFKEGKEVKFNARVPERLRDAFQAVCEQEGRSMSWVVRRYMRKVVREGETGM